MQYYEPNFVGEALVLLERFGTGARVLAGGTRLAFSLRAHPDDASALINIKRIKEFSDISESRGILRIGSLATAATLAVHPLVHRHVPLLAQAAASMGARQLQTVATLGGNLCSGDPASDLAAALLAYDATCEVASAETRSPIPVERFLEAERPLSGSSALLSAVEVPCTPRHGSYQKIMTRRAFEMALVAAAFTCQLEGSIVKNPRVAVGGAATRAIRAYKAERALADKAASEALANEAAQLAAEHDSKPASDWRASEGYRRNLVRVLVQRAIRDALPEM